MNSSLKQGDYTVKPFIGYPFVMPRAFLIKNKVRPVAFPCWAGSSDGRQDAMLLLPPPVPAPLAACLPPPADANPAAATIQAEETTGSGGRCLTAGITEKDSGIMTKNRPEISEETVPATSITPPSATETRVPHHKKQSSMACSLSTDGPPSMTQLSPFCRSTAQHLPDRGLHVACSSLPPIKPRTMTMKMFEHVVPWWESGHCWHRANMRHLAHPGNPVIGHCPRSTLSCSSGLLRPLPPVLPFQLQMNENHFIRPPHVGFMQGERIQVDVLESAVQEENQPMICKPRVYRPSPERPVPSAHLTRAGLLLSPAAFNENPEEVNHMFCSKYGNSAENNKAIKKNYHNDSPSKSKLEKERISCPLFISTGEQRKSQFLSKGSQDTGNSTQKSCIHPLSTWRGTCQTPPKDKLDFLRIKQGTDISHRRTMNPPRYQCDACSKSYATFSGLSKHKQFHCVSQVKKQFTCKFCEKNYVSLGALKMHIRTHTLPCKCQLCGKAFSRPWLLQGHIRTHTGEKPFRCAHCGRSFADRSNLRAHLQTHTDIKKYHCQSCSKTFSRMSLLLKHEDGGCPGSITE